MLRAAYTERTRWWPLVAVATVMLVGAVMVWCVVDSGVEREMKYLAVGTINTPSSLGTLLTGNIQREAGEMVFLSNVRLFAGPKPTLCVVSGAQGRQMLVVLKLPGLASEHLPTTVDVKGLIRRLPSLAVLRREWKLSKDQIHTFEKQRIYIAAEQIQRQDQDATSD